MENQQGNRAGNGPATATAVNESKPPAGGETFPAASAKDAFIGRVLSHYRLEERLGAGGMGLLYRATDQKLGRAVAIKLLARQLVSDETAKARFIQEARAASALDHPNIANVHDIGEEEGELFIVMALYDGETLKQRLEKGRLPVVDARSDLWSAGVLAYELLAGVTPFQTDSSAATTMRILNDDPPSLATVPGVPGWLAELVSQLLRKNPAERPQSAS